MVDYWTSIVLKNEGNSYKLTTCNKAFQQPWIHVWGISYKQTTLKMFCTWTGKVLKKSWAPQKAELLNNQFKSSSSPRVTFTSEEFNQHWPPQPDAPQYEPCQDIDITNSGVVKFLRSLLKPNIHKDKQKDRNIGRSTQSGWQTNKRKYRQVD